MVRKAKAGNFKATNSGSVQATPDNSVVHGTESDSERESDTMSGDKYQIHCSHCDRDIPTWPEFAQHCESVWVESNNKLIDSQNKLTAAMGQVFMGGLAQLNALLPSCTNSDELCECADHVGYRKVTDGPEIE